MADIGVVVATYGDSSWIELATQRAIPSIDRQTVPVNFLHQHHPNSLAQARNLAAKHIGSEWLVFLDADDELHPRFIQAMQQSLRIRPNHALHNPAVQFVIPGHRKPPKMFNTRDLTQGNYLVIGTMVQSSLFWEVGGFDDQWEAYEDWSLWRRCLALGGRIARVPKAIYIAHWNAQGRNNTIGDKEGLTQRIHDDYERWERERSLALDDGRS